MFNAMNNADHAMGIGGGRDMDDINDDDLNDSEDEVRSDCIVFEVSFH